MLTINVRNAFAGFLGTYPAVVDDDGTVRVWDSLAGYYTALHSLTPNQIAYARRRYAAALKRNA